MYPDPNGGPPPAYNPSASAPPPPPGHYPPHAPPPGAVPLPQGGYYYPPQQPVPPPHHQAPPPQHYPQQPYYSAGPQQPAATGYAYAVPPQQYAGMPPPPGQTAYYAPPPPPSQHHGGKIQPMETYAVPPSGGGPAQQVAGVQEDPAGAKPKYQDVWAAILFVLHLGVIVYCAVVPGVKALRTGTLNKTSTEVTVSGPTGSDSSASGEPSLSTGDMWTEYVGIGLVLLAAAVWCGLWLTVLLKNAGNMIKAAFFGSMASSALGIAGALLYGNIPLAGICLFGLLINAMYYYCVRNRIPFAAANLKCAAAAVLKHKSLLCLAGVMALVQIAWVMLWQLAALGVVFTKGEQVVVINGVSYSLANECASEAATNSCFCTDPQSGARAGTQQGLCEDVAVFQTSVSPLAVFLLLVSMFWASLVGKNVVFCTVAGTVADWWYNGDDGRNVVRRSFFRSTTTSFGSICFGSLILAVLRATREMVKAGDRDGQRGDNAARVIVQCLLACIDRLMEIFNRYTMVYCSVFGQSFIESGRKAFDMFKTSGLSAIINDDLAETALNLVAFIVALLSAVVGYIYGAVFLAHSDWPIVLAVVGFFAGLFLALLAMSVIDAGVASIYVLNAEDPEAFMRTHPPLFVELNNAWQAIGYNYQSKTYTRP